MSKITYSRLPVNLPLDKLKSIRHKTLYYPCSGGDFWAPIRYLSPFIDTFWFVDRAYFLPDHQDTRYTYMDQLPETISPILFNPHVQKENEHYSKEFPAEDFDFLSSTVTGDPLIKGRWPHVNPVVFSELYFHRPTQRTIKLNFRRGYGVSGYRKEIKMCGIFFYRGDSMGEGGSGNTWFRNRPDVNFYDKLEEGGFLITDGSNGEWSPLKRAFRGIFHYKQALSLETMIENREHFYSEKLGITLTCYGCMEPGYRRTIIWRINRGQPKAPIPETTQP